MNNNDDDVSIPDNLYPNINGTFFSTKRTSINQNKTNKQTTATITTNPRKKERKSNLTRLQATEPEHQEERERLSLQESVKKAQYQRTKLIALLGRVWSKLIVVYYWHGGPAIGRAATQNKLFCLKSILSLTSRFVLCYVFVCVFCVCVERAFVITNIYRFGCMLFCPWHCILDTKANSQIFLYRLNNLAALI